MTLLTWPRQKSGRGLGKNFDEVAAILDRESHKKVYDNLLVRLKEKTKIELNFSKLEDINLPTVDVETVSAPKDQ